MKEIARWKNKEVFVEVYPFVLRVDEGFYSIDGDVPNSMYRAVSKTIHEINSVMYDNFRLVFRNNTGPSWEFLEREKEKTLDHLRVYFFLANHEQKQKPIGGLGAGNSQSWQKSTSEAFRSYNYPVFAFTHNELGFSPHSSFRYSFEGSQNQTEMYEKMLWAMLHEFTHGMGPDHDDVEKPSIMPTPHSIAGGWDGHYFPNDIKVLRDLYGAVETPEPGKIVPEPARKTIWERIRDRYGR